MTKVPLVSIERDVAIVFPDLRVHGLVCSLPASQVEFTRAGNFSELGEIELDSLSEHPRIAIWRSAIKLMGLKPSEYRSSVEQLVRRQLKDDPAHIGIPVVDLYNSVSKEYIVPFGAYDLEKLTDEEIQIRMIRPSRDQFRPLGGRPERFPLNERVVAYTQGDMILCWALNVRDNELTAVRESSKRILFLSESLNYETSEASDLSMSALEKSISDQDGVVISRFSVGGK